MPLGIPSLERNVRTASQKLWFNRRNLFFTGPIITTNFDRAIEFIFHLTNTKLPDMVIPSDDFQSGKIKESLQQNSPLLIKMHGDIKDIEHLLLRNPIMPLMGIIQNIQILLKKCRNSYKKLLNAALFFSLDVV
ncbi:MAG: hypothetical protein HFG39_04280 [Lachnospiraceae bacterium]|nr:hypothetical protein [Lachnospiraceae bacterium]